MSKYPIPGAVARSPKRWLAVSAVAVVPLIAALTGVVSPARAGSPVLYVDKDSVGGQCSDSRTVEQASSPSTPWCSMSKAIGSAPSGSDVIVRRGSYPYFEVINQRRSAFVSFRPATGESVTLSGGFKVQGSSYFRFSKFKVASTGFTTSLFTSDHVEVTDSDFSPRGMIVRAVRNGVVAGNTFHDLSRTAGKPAPDGYAIWANGYWNGGTQDNIVNLSIRNNRFINIPNDAIQLGGGPSRVFDVTIEGNEFSGVRRRVETDHCDPIQVIGGDGVTIRSNYFHDSEVALMIKDATTKDLVVENNLMLGATGGGIQAQMWDTPGARVINNTIWNSRLGGLRFADETETGGTPSGIVVKNNVVDKYTEGSSAWIAEENYNIIMSGPRRGAHSIGTAPTFDANWGLASGSVGVDAGSSTGTPIVDRLVRGRVDDPNVANKGGGSVSYYDMGAHERQTGTAPAPAPSPSPTPIPAATPTPTPTPSPAPSDATYQVRLSLVKTRTDSVLVDGRTVKGYVYLFASPDTGVSRVAFYLDDPNRQRTPYRIENNAPWDFNGGDSSIATAYDTRKLANGQHSITAALTLPDGSVKVVTAPFTVAN
jgi:hypothetical protein